MVNADCERLIECLWGARFGALAAYADRPEIAADVEMYRYPSARALAGRDFSTTESLLFARRVFLVNHR